MSLVEGRVVFVDTDRNSCDVLAHDGSALYEDINYVTIGNKESGQLDVPEIGLYVIVEIGADNVGHIKKKYSARARNLDGLVEYHSKANRIKDYLPGDEALFGPDGAILELLRGRLASLGSSPLCQTIYFGLENLIRTVCQNYEAFGAGFRIYSIAEDGKVKTRICVSGTENFVTTAAQKSPLSMSEGFPYQIDFDDTGVYFFFGEVDPKTNVRANRSMIHLDPKNGIKILMGEDIANGDVYTKMFLGYTGILVTEIYSKKDSQGKRKKIYQKEVIPAGLGAETVLVNEFVEGNVTRRITGDCSEIIDGTWGTSCKYRVFSGEVLDESSVYKRASTGINQQELSAKPKVTPKTF